MKQKIAQLIERFPDHEAIIKALSRSSERFQDLISDHHDLHRQINRDDTHADPSRSTDLQTRYRNIEEEIIRLIQGSPMA